MESKKRLLIILAILFGLVIIALVVNQLRSKPVTKNITNSIKKKDVALNDVPAGLPDNLPIEAGSEILQNYQAVSNGTSIQGTRKFTTSKTIDEAIKEYKNFFTKLAWQVVDEQADNGFQSILFRRNDSTILVVVKNDAQLEKQVVEVTLTEAVRK